MNIIDIRKHWYACVYDQTFTDTEDDVKFLINIIGNKPKKILEVCCGTGRLLVPLAKANHEITGFDIDEFMMDRISEKSIGMKNINWFKADAINDNWGSGYDVVLLACNILMNIITEDNYNPQKIFIDKASKALKNGGYIYIDFSISRDLDVSSVYNDPEWIIFEGTDDKNIYGKFIMCSNGSYEKETQINYGKRKIELHLPNGERDIFEYEFNKRIPKLDEILEFLKDFNFEIE
jgi:SAM-dependent methyltransferase